MTYKGSGSRMFVANDRHNKQFYKLSYEREPMKADGAENARIRTGIEWSNAALKRTGLDKLDVRG